MSELEDDGTTPPPTDEHDDGDDAAALIAEVQTNEKGDKFVSLGTHIGMRKEAKQAKRELAAKDARIAELEGIAKRLDEVLPIAEAVQKDPELGKLIKQTLDGTRQSRPATEQIADDPEALEMAQDLNLVTKDKDGNDVWDVARAARVLNRATSRAEKKIQPLVDGAREAAFTMRGEQNLTAMFDLTTKSGEPLATEQSIREILKESGTPMHMLANPAVAKSVAMFAAGRDREEGRTPKAPIEPLYLERPGQRRGESRITEMDRRMGERLGLKDADYAAVGKPNSKGEVDLE
jgi:hypothetical protein